MSRREILSASECDLLSMSSFVVLTFLEKESIIVSRREILSASECDLLSMSSFVVLTFLEKESIIEFAW